MNTLERIKLLAKQRGITLKELASKVGIGENSLYRWDKTSPQSDKLQKVADYFDVSTDYLLGRTEKKKYYELSDKEKKDIAIQAEELIEGIANGENLNFTVNQLLKNKRPSFNCYTYCDGNEQRRSQKEIHT